MSVCDMTPQRFAISLVLFLGGMYVLGVIGAKLEVKTNGRINAGTMWISAAVIIVVYEILFGY
jgi:hypothetical protein